LRPFGVAVEETSRGPTFGSSSDFTAARLAGILM
jgi:hypothetical protein